MRKSYETRWGTHRKRVASGSRRRVERRRDVMKRLESSIAELDDLLKGGYRDVKVNGTYRPIKDVLSYRKQHLEYLIKITV